MRFWLLLVLLLVASCAPEQSAEERRREDIGRTLDRLKYAAGHYAGYLLNSPTEITPVTLDIAVTNNPTNSGDKPLLSASLQIGLFGGVTVASSSTSFDWGASEIVATFAKSSGGSSGEGGSGGTPGSGHGGTGSGGGGTTTGSGSNSTGFELRGNIVNGEFTNGTLVGSHLGSRKIVLKKDAPNIVDPTQERAYDVLWKPKAKEPDLRALLKIKTKPVTQPAPGTSDLGYLPGLEGSVTFDSLSSAPQNAMATLYDPTTATLDLQFSDHSWIRTSGVSLSLQTQAVIPPTGRLSNGGDTVRELTLSPLTTDAVLPASPPATYLGIYQGAPDAPINKAVAYLKFLGETGSNTLNLPFVVFPAMRLEVDICTGSEVLIPMSFKLHDLDYMEHKAVFHRMTTEQDPLEIIFSNQWTKLKGTFLQVDPHTGGKQPTVKLQPNAEVAQLGCEVVLP